MKTRLSALWQLTAKLSAMLGHEHLYRINFSVRTKSCSMELKGSYEKLPLDVFPYEEPVMVFVPRAATTTDVFNAIAEPRRRQIIELLAR